MDELEVNPSVERGDTDPEGVKNQVPETHNGAGANSTVEMTPPPAEPPLVP
jgi:hypothetical protein